MDPLDNPPAIKSSFPQNIAVVRVIASFLDLF